MTDEPKPATDEQIERAFQSTRSTMTRAFCNTLRARIDAEKARADAAEEHAAESAKSLRAYTEQANKRIAELQARADAAEKRTQEMLDTADAVQAQQIAAKDKRIAELEAELDELHGLCSGECFSALSVRGGERDG